MNISEVLINLETSVDLLHMTKTDAVCAILREAIITARLKPGDHLRQQDFANQLQMSATPVREALQKLDALGILKHTPHQGAQVPIPNRETINEIFQVRAILEGVAILNSIDLIKPKTLLKLNELASEIMPKCLEEGYRFNDFTPYRKANYEFHKKIYSSSFVMVIPDLIDNLWARSVVPDELFHFGCELISKAYKEHIKIIKALKEKDADLARATMEHHVDLTRICYLQLLDQDK